MLAESATLPIGAVVLLSDGADNSGGIDLETISEIRRQRIPVHTVGFGREQFASDVEIEDVQMPAKALPSSRLEAQVSFQQHGYSGRKLRVEHQRRRQGSGLRRRSRPKRMACSRPKPSCSTPGRRA